jgi:hypothetical protein
MPTKTDAVIADSSNYPFAACLAGQRRGRLLLRGRAPFATCIRLVVRFSKVLDLRPFGNAGKSALSAVFTAFELWNTEATSSSSTMVVTRRRPARANRFGRDFE